MEAPEEKKKIGSQPKKWLEIPEVRMLMYVIPVGLVLAIIGLFLSQVSGR